tara:strand:+ start:15728 stop:16384 length:657 start_codon:yes stop_codon:yes gene_type:complete
MKKRTIIAFVLLLLLTTITFRQKIFYPKFEIKEIIVENNLIIKEKEIKKLILSIYTKNLLLLKNSDIEKELMKNSFVDSFVIKKKYPDKLIIKIYEKRPIAIIVKKKKRYYLSEKIDLIEFKNFRKFQNLPYIFGDEKEFEVLYKNLNKINFPLKLIKKYSLYETNRWDLETYDNKVIKLPSKGYSKSLENYLSLLDKKNFEKFKLFDYRINNQLILK